MFYNCHVQEIKVQEQFLVHMNIILTNWKILPSPSENNLPLSKCCKTTLGNSRLEHLFTFGVVTWYIDIFFGQSVGTQNVTRLRHHARDTNKWSDF